jgi:hypothetical protein
VVEWKFVQPTPLFVKTGHLLPNFRTQSGSKSVTIKILMAVAVNTIVFWDVTLFAILEIIQCFGQTCCFSVKGGIVPDLLSI